MVAAAADGLGQARHDPHSTKVNQKPPDTHPAPHLQPSHFSPRSGTTDAPPAADWGDRATLESRRGEEMPLEQSLHGVEVLALELVPPMIQDVSTPVHQVMDRMREQNADCRSSGPPALWR